MSVLEIWRGVPIVSAVLKGEDFNFLVDRGFQLQTAVQPSEVFCSESNGIRCDVWVRTAS